jgi:hypothetical protein
MGILASLIRIVLSGIRPGPGQSLAWYDRVIRVGGGLFIIGVILYVFLAARR